MKRMCESGRNNNNNNIKGTDLKLLYLEVYASWLYFLCAVLVCAYAFSAQRLSSCFLPPLIHHAQLVVGTIRFLSTARYPKARPL